MDQHPGASITLSFALVVSFAIVFYQPEQPPAANANVNEAARLEPSAAIAETIPPLTPVEALPEPTPHTPTPAFAAIAPAPEVPSVPEGGAESIAQSGRDSERDVERAAKSTVTGDRLDPGPPSGPSSKIAEETSGRPPTRLPAQDGFTTAIEGETLRDVALRVYGVADEDETLWRLNRDLLGRREGTLAAGTPLRTP
jgi:nucleoid-associated protein YgaU